jgi:hypothetical protein
VNAPEHLTGVALTEYIAERLEQLGGINEVYFAGLLRSGQVATDAFALRDRELVLAASFIQGANLNAIAKELARLFSLYETTSWRHDQLHDEPPSRIVGKVNERFFRALKLRNVTLDRDRIYRILRAKS